MKAYPVNGQDHLVKGFEGTTSLESKIRIRTEEKSPRKGPQYRSTGVKRGQLPVSMLSGPSCPTEPFRLNHSYPDHIGQGINYPTTCWIPASVTREFFSGFVASYYPFLKSFLLAFFVTCELIIVT